MNNWAERISQWMANAACICLLILMLVTFVDVVGRNFNTPLKFAVEIIQLGMGLLIFLGLAITTLRKGHIAVDLISSAVGPIVGRILGLFASLATTIFIGLMAWRLWDRAGNFMSDGLVTDILDLPVFPVVFVMAIAAGVGALIAAMQLFGLVSNEPEEQPSYDPES